MLTVGFYPLGIPMGIPTMTPMVNSPPGMIPMVNSPPGMIPMRNHPMVIPPMRNHPMVIPPMRNHPMVIPPMRNYPTVMPPMRNYPTVMSPMRNYPTVMSPLAMPPMANPPSRMIQLENPNAGIHHVYETRERLDNIKPSRLRKIMEYGDIKALKEISKELPKFYKTKIHGDSLLSLCFDEGYTLRTGEIKNRRDNHHVAEFLLQSGEDINRYINGKNFSHVACKRRNYYFLRFLLKHNANFFDTDCKGVTAIEYACRNRWFDGLFLILSKINIKEKHRKVFKKMCKILTDTNPQNSPDYDSEDNPFPTYENVINKRFSNGETILHLMVKKRNLIAVELLLSFGANPMIKNYDGISPYKLILDNNWNEKFLFLLEAVNSKSNAVPLHETHKFKWFC